MKTEWQKAEEGEGYTVQGCFRAMILDPFSYNIEARILGPSLLTISGMHLPPDSSDLPPGTRVVDPFPQGPWSTRDSSFLALQVLQITVLLPICTMNGYNSSILIVSQLPK